MAQTTDLPAALVARSRAGRRASVLSWPKRPESVGGASAAGQPHQVVRLHRRAALHADRVLDTLEELDVGAVEVAGPFADPYQVSRGVVPLARGAIDPGHRLFEVEQQGLVAGEELHLVQRRLALGGDADRLHEHQGLADLLSHLAVSRALRTAVDEAQG